MVVIVGSLDGTRGSGPAPAKLQLPGVAGATQHSAQHVPAG